MIFHPAWPKSRHLRLYWTGAGAELSLVPGTEFSAAMDSNSSWMIWMEDMVGALNIFGNEADV
jgi:hypothetical protein